MSRLTPNLQFGLGNENDVGSFTQRNYFPK